MTKARPSIKLGSSNKSFGAIKSATRKVSGNSRNSDGVHTMSQSKDVNSQTDENGNKVSSSKQNDDGNYSQDQGSNFAARLVQSGNNLAYVRGFFGKNARPGALAGSGSSSSLSLTPSTGSSLTPIPANIAASSINPISGYGNGSSGGIGVFDDVPENPDLVNFDPDKMPGYKKAAEEIRQAVADGKISISEINHGIAMGQGLGGGQKARQKFQDHLVHNLAIMTSKNPKLLEHLKTTGLNAVFANGGIGGTAADGASGVGAYMQVGGNKPNLVLGAGRDATTIFHEMTHYFDGTDRNGMDGVLEVKGFAGVISRAQGKMSNDINRLSSLGFSRLGYGLSNNQETLAVLSENYFRRNEIFRQEFPEMAKAFDGFFGAIDDNIRLEPKPDSSGQNAGTEQLAQLKETESNDAWTKDNKAKKVA